MATEGLAEAADGHRGISRGCKWPVSDDIEAANGL